MTLAEVVTLKRELSAELLGCLKAVPDQSLAAAKFARLVADPPVDAGSELTSTVAVINMFNGVFALMAQYHNPSITLQLSANKTERQAGSSSQLVGPRLRPDELFVWQMCTMMLCEDKVSSW